MRRSSFVLLLLAPALGACYRYVPLRAPVPAVGTELRSHLTQEGVASMAPTLGRNVVAFDGRLLSTGSDVWRFAVSETRTGDARSIGWDGAPVDISRSLIGRMEQRVLDRPKTIRTAILAVLGGVAVGLSVKAIKGEASGNPGGGGTIPP